MKRTCRCVTRDDTRSSSSEKANSLGETDSAIAVQARADSKEAKKNKPGPRVHRCYVSRETLGSSTSLLPLPTSGLLRSVDVYLGISENSSRS